MTLIIVDDGTLDTVVECTVCNERLRYNPEPLKEDADKCILCQQKRRSMALDMAVEDHRCEP
jgi:hypothetical protein